MLIMATSFAFGIALFLSLTLVSVRTSVSTVQSSMVSETKQKAQRTPTSEPPAEALIPIKEDSSEALPEWVNLEHQTLKTGEVPTELLVTKSSECPTVAEAETEALSKAKQELLKRLAAKYPGIDTWNMPLSLINDLSKQQYHVQFKLRNFGSFQDTMFVAYVQYMDSPEVRERVVEEWEQINLNSRLLQVAGVFGASVIGLSTLSIALRWSSRYRKSHQAQLTEVA